MIKQRNKLHREGWILQLKVPQIQSTAAPGPGPSTFCFTNPSCVCASTAQQAFAKKKCLSTTSWYNHCLHKVGTDLCTKSNKSQELGVKGVREGAEHRPARERAKDGGMEASAHTLTSAARGGLGHPPACHCLQHRFSAKGKGSNAGNSHFGGSSLHPHPPCTVGR